MSARRIGLAMNRFYTKQTKNFEPKIFSYLIFSKKSEETSCCSEDKFRGQFNLRRRVKAACSQIHNLANGMWNWNTKNNKSEINTFKFHLFMLKVHADLKISLYVQIHLKIISWKFCILNSYKSQVIYPQILRFS